MQISCEFFLTLREHFHRLRLSRDMKNAIESDQLDPTGMTRGGKLLLQFPSDIKSKSYEISRHRSSRIYLLTYSKKLSLNVIMK
jgi:hypothetical protein